MSGRARVVYWGNMPSPYVVERFNAVADRGNIDFIAWFSVEREPDRSWEVHPSDWRFPARYVGTGGAFLGRQICLPLRHIAAARPDLLITGVDRISPILGGLAARGVGARIAYRALPEFDSWVPPSFGREIARRFLFRQADGAKTPGEMGAALAERLGLPRDRIWRVTQSIDLRHFGGSRRLPEECRASRRRELGLSGCVFIYVGRLWAGKGFDYLLRAYRQLQAENSDVSLLVVGDGVDEARYRQLARSIPGVVFVGFIQPSSLAEYYALADVMVFPTLGDPHGLVLEEALAAGLPVITTSAAGDVGSRLPVGSAGFIVEPASAPSLYREMRKLAGAPELRARLAAGSWDLVERLTHEQYAKDLESFVAGILSMPRRRTPEAFLAKVVGLSLMQIGWRLSRTRIANQTGRR